jgi:hypothetical protein
MLKARLLKSWHDLPEALHTGRPQDETKHGENSIFEELYGDSAKLASPASKSSVLPAHPAPQSLTNSDDTDFWHLVIHHLPVALPTFSTIFPRV